MTLHMDRTVAQRAVDQLVVVFLIALLGKAAVALEEASCRVVRRGHDLGVLAADFRKGEVSGDTESYVGEWCFFVNRP